MTKNYSEITSDISSNLRAFCHNQVGVMLVFPGDVIASFDDLIYLKSLS